MSFEPFPGVRIRGPPVPDDPSSLMHKCTGPSCTFCAWRRENPIELGWERLLEPEEACADGSTLCGVDLTSSQMSDPSLVLCTKRTTDFLANFDDESYFPQLDAEFEQVLTQVETCASQSVYTANTMCTSSVTMASTTVTSANRVYASPKGKAAVQSARAASIPTKTREQTEWAVRVWQEWALARNTRLLSDEEPFSTTFCELTVSEMDFWLSRFVLEVRKKNGDPYPPNTLYQLICGLQRQLREHGHADIKLFDNPSLHGFRSTLDGEMKRLNGTGNYLKKSKHNL